MVQQCYAQNSEGSKTAPSGLSTCEIFGINYCKWFKTSPLYNKAAMPKKHCEVGRLLLGEIFKNVLYRLLLGI